MIDPSDGGPSVPCIFHFDAPHTDTTEVNAYEWFNQWSNGRYEHALSFRSAGHSEFELYRSNLEVVNEQGLRALSCRYAAFRYANTKIVEQIDPGHPAAGLLFSFATVAEKQAAQAKTRHMGVVLQSSPVSQGKSKTSWALNLVPKKNKPDDVGSAHLLPSNLLSLPPGCSPLCAVIFDAAPADAKSLFLAAHPLDRDVFAVEETIMRIYLGVQHVTHVICDRIPNR